MEQCEAVTDCEVGIDWVALTAYNGNKHYEPWAAGAQAWVERGLTGDNELKAAGGSGYKGFSVGQRYIGYRDDGAMLRASGKESGNALSVFFRDWLGIPRIDIQATVWVGSWEVAKAIENHYLAVQRAIAQAEIPTRKVSKVQSNDGSVTVYVGSRQSEVFIRIYDKWRESGDDNYHGCVRYEVEYKGGAAKQVATSLHYLPPEKLRKVILDTVVMECATRHVYIPWVPKGDSGIVLAKSNAPSDAEKRLKWLREQVSPTIRVLVGRGLLFETMEALGLPGADWGEIERGLTG